MCSGFARSNSCHGIDLLLGLLSPPVPAEAQPDTSLFATLAQYVARNGLWHQKNPHLQIDPRAISISHIPLALRERDLINVPHEKLRRRAEILKRLSIPQTDILADYECLGSGGLRLPREAIAELDSTIKWPPEPAYPQRCEEKSFTRVIFGQLRPAGPNCPPDSTQRQNKQRQNKRPACYAVRAIEVASYSFSEYDLILRRTPDGGWIVVQKKLIDGIAS